MKKLFLLLLGVVIGFLICYFYCDNKIKLGAPPMNTPKGIITPEQAKILDDAYDSRHDLISDSIVGRPDNRSAWWSLEDIEGFISYAKKQSTELGYDMNGIRVYLGAHENDGYTTVFMVPTGNPSVSKGSMLSIAPGNGDVPGGNGLNDGGEGEPPRAKYPQ
ncbi:hypothetical protein KO494_13260 [Lacinutrix sp. C3R15]|uniref:hypothetical protein n=1 Tax=Flavobacteriaceae TaxID=49546 RepID=UPI001C085B5F|nr:MULTISPECIES: hypothetical protein [Flavobacteriaceae]MBU2940510.1 hypothetical protein [Lacinutrix sp. C3R15]MDO6623830.1 hypothetical protein [Oceanihabitans sp. 1_MG-2023]